jgi:hypothetical protein
MRGVQAPREYLIKTEVKVIVYGRHGPVPPEITGDPHKLAGTITPR